MSSIFNGINNSVFTYPTTQSGSGGSSTPPTGTPPLSVSNNIISLDTDNLISLLSNNINLTFN